MRKVFPTAVLHRFRAPARTLCPRSLCAPGLQFFAARRDFSDTADAPTPTPVLGSQRRNYLSPIFAGLFVVGTGLTVYGLYDVYGAMKMWPPEIRQDLKDGLLAKYKGNLELGEQHMRKAWETARTLPLSAFEPMPYLKTSGVAIALAGVLEQAHKSEYAYAVYVEALDQLPTSAHSFPPLPAVVSGNEYMRVVAIAYRLAQLAHELRKPPAEEEKWLVLAVDTLLLRVLAVPAGEITFSVGKGQEGTEGTAEGETGELGDKRTAVMVSELELPPWVRKHDLAAPFEALASFYVKQKKYDFAMPLYLQAVSILIPPPPLKSTVNDKCRGAQLMGNVGDLILGRSLSPEALIQAEMWARKGLDVVQATRAQTMRKHDACELAYAVLLYNVGVVREMLGDAAEARQLLQESLLQSSKSGLLEGVSKAESALSKVGTGDLAIEREAMVEADTRA